MVRVIGVFLSSFLIQCLCCIIIINVIPNIWIHVTLSSQETNNSKEKNRYAMMPCDIQYIIIVREVIISGTTAARGLKFWLQVDLGPPIAPWGRRPDPAHPDPGNPVFPEIFFSLFLASTASWDLRVTPRMHRNHLIRIRIREIRFFEKSGLFVFSTF